MCAHLEPNLVEVMNRHMLLLALVRRQVEDCARVQQRPLVRFGAFIGGGPQEFSRQFWCKGLRSCLRKMWRGT